MARHRHCSSRNEEEGREPALFSFEEQSVQLYADMYGKDTRIILFNNRIQNFLFSMMDGTCGHRSKIETDPYNN
jgi:hypothetical protein